MSSNLFTGLGDLYRANTPTQNSSQRSFKTFAGHVIEICMTSDGPLYESPRDIGKIKFRDLVTEYNRAESELTKFAYPLDRSIARYPFPGEEVIIYQAVGESDSTINTTLANIYFYSFVVSAMHNVSFNANPFFGTDAANIDPSTQLSNLLNLVSNLVDPNSAKTRFDVKIADINLVKDGSNKLKVYKQLQPFEGDFILQGRFGNTIRFGSTSAKNETPWSSGSNKPGISGDAVMVLRVDRDYVTNEESMLAQENPDVDDASIYLCTSQRVLLTLGCSKELKTWKSRYNINDSNASGAGSNITKTRDTSELWQKAVESDQPISQTFESPTN